MTAENLATDNCRDREAVEAVCERLPQLDRVASFALVIEAINSVDGGALMVPAEEPDFSRVFHFQRQQQCNRFEGLRPS